MTVTWYQHLRRRVKMVTKAICYHLPVYLYYVYVMTYDFVNIEKGREGYGGKFKYLTIWNLCIQCAYFGLALLNDFCGSDVRPSSSKDVSSQRSLLQRLRDLFLASTVFPVGAFVVFTFWGIYAVDRELVFPKELDKFIPLWLNHALHTVVVPLLLVEMFLVYHQFPRKRTGLGILYTLALMYLSWIFWIAYISGFWVYPVLRVLNNKQRAIFIGVLLVFFAVLYFLGDLINRMVWDRERKIATKKVKQK